jgi:predicted DNA-binding ribbon-helix-helix protein
MRRLFASQSPESYAFETRPIRLNGQDVRIRLEKIFWQILDQIAEREQMSAQQLISTLHSEILLVQGEVANFTSHLKCICLIAVEEGRASSGIDHARAA